MTPVPSGLLKIQEQAQSMAIMLDEEWQTSMDSVRVP